MINQNLLSFFSPTNTPAEIADEAG